MITNIKTTPAQKNELRKKFDNNGMWLRDEKVWTWLLASVISDSPKKQLLQQMLIGNKEIIKSDLDFWYEAQPIPPRQGKSKSSEGNSKLDLSFGDIKLRKGTELGIEYNKNNGWVCFIEAKLFSDCSTSTSYDPFRNQLARVIENLITFQDSNNTFPEKTYFTLLTPRIFKEQPYSKLYGYKYFEYQDIDKLLQEFELSPIGIRNTNSWKYPSNLQERLKSITLNWVTYEEIFEQAIGWGKEITSLEDTMNLPKELLKIMDKL